MLTVRKAFRVARHRESAQPASGVRLLCSGLFRRRAPRKSTCPVIRGQSRSILRTEFPAELASVSNARRQLREQLTTWELEPLMEPAVLATSELVTNAVLHGCSGKQDKVAMTAWCTTDELVISVADPSDVGLHARRSDADDESGRGLMLVGAIADRWWFTTAQDGAGKTVWLALSLPRCTHGEGE
ncbi:ATP-binding protein [Streptomyces lydicus]